MKMKNRMKANREIILKRNVQLENLLKKKNQNNARRV